METTDLFVQWSDDGQHIRKWSREPFEGATQFTPDLPERGGWRDIASAPKDGTWFVARATAKGWSAVRVVHYAHKEDRLPIDHTGWAWPSVPTEWMTTAEFARLGQSDDIAMGMLRGSAEKHSAICADLADKTPISGEPDPLWWERQSALREASVLLGYLAAPATTPAPAGELEEMRAVHKKEVSRLERLITDNAYMIAALVSILGPNGRKVWDNWQAQGVARVHYDWQPEARSLTGEERAEMILAFDAAPKTLIEDVDAHLANTNPGATAKGVE